MPPETIKRHYLGLISGQKHIGLKEVQERKKAGRQPKAAPVFLVRDHRIVLDGRVFASLAELASEQSELTEVVERAMNRAYQGYCLR